MIFFAYEKSQFLKFRHEWVPSKTPCHNNDRCPKLHHNNLTNHHHHHNRRDYAWSNDCVVHSQLFYSFWNESCRVRTDSGSCWCSLGSCSHLATYKIHTPRYAIKTYKFLIISKFLYSYKKGIVL